MFYEQYLDIWTQTLKSIGFSLLSVCVVSLIVTGFDFFAAFTILLLVFMVVVNMGGFMYLWSITLNAISLVNLVMVRFIYYFSCKLKYCLFLGYWYFS